VEGCPRVGIRLRDMSDPTPKTYLFVGPTLSDISSDALALLQEAVVLPPCSVGM